MILVGMLLAQLADAVTFAAAVNRLGIEAESNRWAVALFSSGGIDAVLVGKLIAIVVMIGLIAHAASRFPKLLVMGGATATSLGLLGFVTNSLALLLRA